MVYYAQMPVLAPSWKKYEDDMKSNDSKKAMEAGDLFVKEREWETKHSNELKEWEEGRKKDIANQKPAWVKQQLSKEKEESAKELQKFKKAGNIDYKIKPSRGYLLIKIFKEEEKKTDSGLLLVNDETIPNEIADVIAVGDDLILEKNIVPTPCQVGDRVLLKKMAGLEVTSYGDDLRICLFSDVLAILEE